MKKLQLFFATVIVMLGVSCQNDEELVAPQAGDAIASADVEYLAETFYKTLPDEELARVASAYQAMDYEQASSFIEARYEINLREEMSPRQAVAIRDLMHEVNKKVFDQTEQSFASVDQDILVEVYSLLIQKEDYADVAYQDLQGDDQSSRTAVATCPNGSWFKTKRTPWTTLPLYGFEWEVNFLGNFNFGGNSNDCDYVFQSRRYNIYYGAKKVFAKTNAAINALLLFGDGFVPSKEPAVNQSEAQLEFLVGKGRIDVHYLGGSAPQRFANDVKIMLEPR